MEDGEYSRLRSLSRELRRPSRLEGRATASSRNDARAVEEPECLLIVLLVAMDEDVVIGDL